MSPDDDLHLLRDCLEGSREAWAEFVRRFAPYLAEVCRVSLARCRRPSGPQEVDDMLQEVFLNFMERDLLVLRAYRGRAPLKDYLAAVAVNRVLGDRGSRPLFPNPAFQSSPMTDPSEDAAQQEMLELLRRQIGLLPARDRMALELQGRGCSAREIGEVLGLSEDAAAKLLSRARIVLQARLKR